MRSLSQISGWLALGALLQIADTMHAAIKEIEAALNWRAWSLSLCCAAVRYVKPPILAITGSRNDGRIFLVYMHAGGWM